MRVPRFYTDQPLSDLRSTALDEEASHHILRVLRLRAGDALIVFNGDGRDYNATLTDTSGKRAIIEITDARDPCRESLLRIELGQGISRGERMEFVLQKSVELGVSSITPLWTARSQVSLSGPRLEKRLSHWHGVIRSASEQSGRAIIPSLENPRNVADWCSASSSQLQVVLDPDGPLSLRELARASSVSLLIGPEGGLDDDEIRLAESHGFKRIRLGPRILRTETAALAALSAVQTLWGDFSD